MTTNLDDLMPRGRNIGVYRAEAQPGAGVAAAAEPPDGDLDSALRLHRQQAAERLNRATVQRMIDEAEVDGLEAELRREETAFKLEQLRAARQPAAPEQAGSDAMAMLMTMMAEREKTLSTEISELRSQQATQLRDELTAMRESMRALAEGGRAQPPGIVDQLKAMIELQNTIQNLVPRQPESEAHRSVQDIIAMSRAQDEARLRQLEFDLQKAQSDADRETKLAEIDVQRQRMAMMAGMVQQVGPELITAAVARLAGVPVPEGVGGGATAPAAEPAQLPVQCPHCLFDFTLPPGISMTFCPRCRQGMTLSIEGGDQAPPSIGEEVLRLPAGAAEQPQPTPPGP